MALAAIIDTFEFNPDGSARLIAVVTDNVSVKIRVDRVLPIGTTVEVLKVLLSNVIQSAPNLDDLKALPLGVVIDLTPVPTPVQPLRPLLAYLQAKDFLTQAQTLVSEGLVAPDDPNLLALVDLVITMKKNANAEAAAQVEAAVAAVTDQLNAVKP